MIRLDALTIGYHACDLLEPLTLDFRPGEFTAVVGANGAGKTTLLKTIAGLLAPLSGNVYVDELPLSPMHMRKRAMHLAFVDSETEVFGSVSVRDVVGLGRLPHRPWWSWVRDPQDQTIVDEALVACGLTRLAEREFRLLSSGERQRVWIAAAFAQAAPCILLDEPTSRLDIRYAKDVLELLRTAARRNAVVVATMHDLERAAAYADRIIVLGERCVLADGPPVRELNEHVLERAYGVAIDMRREDDRLWFLPKR